jgi:hypothetical protein
MGQNSIYKNSWFIIVVIAIFMSFAFSNAMSYQKTDTSILHLLKHRSTKTPLFKNSLHLVLPPIRPAVISTTKVSIAKTDDKLLTNVQVYPNPVTDQINLKYEISRPSNVTIKVMDVLGNEIITLYNQRVEPGEQSFSYALNNKLSRGFYFVRVIAGTESVIRRIAVVVPN